MKIQLRTAASILATTTALVACRGGDGRGGSIPLAFGGPDESSSPPDTTGGDGNSGDHDGNSSEGNSIDGNSSGNEGGPAAIDKSAQPAFFPDSVRPINYKLWFRPDADLKGFSGRADVLIEVEEPVQDIVVAAHHLEIANGRTVVQPGNIELTPTPQTYGDLYQLRARDEIPAGRYTLHMEWTGHIHFSDEEWCTPEEMPLNPYCSAAQGMFRVGLQGPDGAIQDAIVTQGETNFARQWFPSWDEPAFRMTFDITAEVPGEWKTVSNGAPLTPVKLLDGWQQASFERTPPMPTYLVFFGGGPFDVLEDELRSPLDGRSLKLRWFTPPGEAHWADSAMKWTRDALTYYYDYTGIPLPFTKFDTVAANDGYDNKHAGFGGMENWGAIFEFAGGVLTRPGDDPAPYATTVITHEIAHQWFGDLVTPDWWDNVWLNESFARWFDRKTIIELRPGQYSLTDYVLDKYLVMDADLSSTAVPVQRNLIDVGSFGFVDPAIFVYNKGSHVLQMLEDHIGKGAMRRGLQIYLTDYAYGNVTPERLWSSLEKAAQTPLAGIGDTFVRQTGFPLLTVDAQCDAARDKNIVTLSQEPFPNENTHPGSLWTVPVTLAYGEQLAETSTIVMSGPRARIELDGCSAVLADPTGQDYYVANYSPQSWSALLAQSRYLVDQPRATNIVEGARRLLAAGKISQASFDTIAHLTDPQ